jgi:hypothetical protein
MGADFYMMNKEADHDRIEKIAKLRKRFPKSHIVLKYYYDGVEVDKWLKKLDKIMTEW